MLRADPRTAGLPALGFLGPAIATSIVQTGIAAGLTLFTHTACRPHVRWTRPRWATASALLRLGLPIGATYAVETTLFLAVAILLGLLGPAPLAAQQVALMSISIAFMIPLGLAQAANVRVGYAVGARDPVAARRAGLAAIALGAAVEFAFRRHQPVRPEQVVRLF